MRHAMTKSKRRLKQGKPSVPPLPSKISNKEKASSPLLKFQSLPSLEGKGLPPNNQVDLQQMQPYSKALAAAIKRNQAVGPALAAIKKSLSRELSDNPNAVNQPELLAQVARQLLQDPSFLVAMSEARNELGPLVR